MQSNPGHIFQTPLTRLPRGRVYTWIPDTGRLPGGSIAPAIEPLRRLESFNGGGLRLQGRYVHVRNAGEVNDPEPDSSRIRIVPIGDAQPNPSGDFLFDPARGGGRLDRVPVAEPELRQRYIEASHFGEVNAYYHLDRIAAYIDGLLHELGHPSLPQVTAVVNAHHAATEHEGVRDGVRGTRSGRWLPLQGGHYRLPSWRYDPDELQPPSPLGEIHLGPGWQLHRDGAIVAATGGTYWSNAAHNGAILYHEYGHHIMRHTADVRVNSLRPPDKQSNRKAAIDEGTSDYWAAAMLNTPHIWAWHRRHDRQEIHPRSLASQKTMADFDSSPTADPHLNGTIWAAALWDLRTCLQNSSPDGAYRADLLVLQALLLIGRLSWCRDVSDVKPLRRAREQFGVGLAALLRADELLNGGQNRELISSCFRRRRIFPEANLERKADGSLCLR